jgi:tetratricopeptide (TPR) repeat protein
MKAIYKNLALGIFLTVFAAVTAAPTFAQDVCKDVDANQALYKKYTDNYAGTLEQVKTAIAAAEEYIQKYEACKDDKGVATFAEQVNYFKGALPERKDFVDKSVKAADGAKLYDRFNTAAKAKNVAEILASGKEVVAKYPNDLDVIIIMASAAFDEVIAKPTVTTFNNDAITYSKSAIEKIEAGVKSESGNYGAWGYVLKNKNNALGILNYSIGNTLLLDAAKKKEAAPYFYKAAQVESNIKNEPIIYRAIGANYLDEVVALDKKRTEIIKAAGDKDTEESLATEAMQKGYAERAINAYARAYKIAKGDPKKKDLVEPLATTLKQLYAFRYTGKTLDNIDTYVATVTSNTLVDPTTTVTPVKEEVPTTPATTTPGTTTPANNTAPATTATPKPATTTAPKPATTPTKPVSSTTAKPETTTDVNATATAKPKTKKPAPKKKGTR